MEEIYAWAALIAIFVIPLASMVHRMLRKRMENKKNVSQTTMQEKKQFQINTEKYSESGTESFGFQPENMLVLGELVRGSTTFENIQKNIGLDGKGLDEILENLEKNQLLRVEEKKGLLGIKIELYPTDKGLKEYSYRYS